jgi:licheninase
MRIRHFHAAGAVLALTLAGALSGTPSLHQARLDAAGRPLAIPAKAINWGAPTWADTFNGTRLNLKRWSKYVDPTGKLSGWRRTKASVRVHNGELQVIGHRQAPYGLVGGGLSYNIDQTYGRWAVRFRADAGSGWEPVVLLWPKGTWPDDGEIDMAEIKNSTRLGAGEFLHLGVTNRFIGHPIPASVNFTRWHILSVDWLPGHITFWLDGRKLWTVPRRTGDQDYVPSTPFHLALQNDVGCDDHQCRPGGSTPKRVVMHIDWVRIWKAPASAS